MKENCDFVFGILQPLNLLKKFLQERNRTLNENPKNDSWKVLSLKLVKNKPKLELTGENFEV